MTSFTQLTGYRMCRGFRCARTVAVMTAGGVARLPCHCAVIEYNLQPIGCVVTGIASVRGGDVIRPFAGGDSAVVTVLTGVAGLAVVKR
jgi:hypothetical protein